MLWQYRRKGAHNGTMSASWPGSMRDPRVKTPLLLLLLLLSTVTRTGRIGRFVFFTLWVKTQQHSQLSPVSSLISLLCFSLPFWFCGCESNFLTGSKECYWYCEPLRTFVFVMKHVILQIASLYIYSIHFVSQRVSLQSPLFQKFKLYSSNVLTHFKNCSLTFLFCLI